MFSISIQATTIEEARAKIKALAESFGVAAGAEPAAAAKPDAPAPKAPAPAASPAQAPAAKKEEAAAEGPSKQVVMKALQNVMELKTPEEAQALLEQATGARNFSKVAPEKYGALLDACNAALKAAKAAS